MEHTYRKHKLENLLCPYSVKPTESFHHQSSSFEERVEMIYKNKKKITREKEALCILVGSTSSSSLHTAQRLRCIDAILKRLRGACDDVAVW